MAATAAATSPLDEAEAADEDALLLGEVAEEAVLGAPCPTTLPAPGEHDSSELTDRALLLWPGLLLLLLLLAMLRLRLLMKWESWVATGSGKKHFYQVSFCWENLGLLVWPLWQSSSHPSMALFVCC